nr:immunoglobulin heavy chain junction region [Macaca mulatta]
CARDVYGQGFDYW